MIIEYNFLTYGIHINIYVLDGEMYHGRTKNGRKIFDTLLET